MNADLEVVIPVFNGMPYLEQAVMSCLCQVDVNLTVTVIDNASTDGTWDWLCAAADEDSRLNVIRNQSNIGMIPNIKKCFSQIRSPNFCFLCADDKLISNTALSKAFQILNCHNNVGVVYSDLVYSDSINRILLKRKFRRSGIFSARELGYKCVLEGRNLFGIPLLTRSCLLEKVEFDESLSYAADIDFALQIGALTGSWHLPEFLIANRYHGGNATGRLQGQALTQFTIIAERYGYSLKRISRLKMRIFTYKNTLLRSLFLQYAKLRSPGTQ